MVTTLPATLNFTAFERKLTSTSCSRPYRVISIDTVAGGSEGEGDDIRCVVGGDHSYDRLWPL